jgi:copper chaperone
MLESSEPAVASRLRSSELNLERKSMRYEIKIEGMNCGHCVMAVKQELSKLPGIETIDVEIGSATVDVGDDSVSKEQLYAAIEEAGFIPVM